MWSFDLGTTIRPGQLHGSLDSARASAAHVIDDGDYIRMYYWGTGSDGLNRILLARALKTKPAKWEPMGSVLECQPMSDYNSIGPSFPHVVPMDDKRWLLYFAGWGHAREDRKLPNRTGVALSEDGGASFTYPTDQPVIGLDRKWDREGTGSICIVRAADRLRMYYTAIGSYFPKPTGIRTAHEGSIPEIGVGYAESIDGLSWEKPLNDLVVKPRGTETSPYEYIVSKPHIIEEEDGLRMWVNTCGIAYRMRSLWSRDGLTWEWFNSGEDGDMGIGPTGAFDDEQRCYVSVLRNDDTYHCWYTGNGYGTTGMGYARAVASQGSEN